MASIPLKRVVAINPELLPDGTPPEFEFDYVDIGSVGRGYLFNEPTRMRFEDAPSRARRVLRPGDTIVSTVRTYLRAVLPVRRRGLIGSTGFACLRPQAGVEPRFLGWWAQSDSFIEEVVARSVGVSYPAINTSEIGLIRIAVPPPSDQRTISDFLDTETARIDALLEKKRSLIELLDEYIDARIRMRIGESSLGGGRQPAVQLRRLLAPADHPVRQDAGMITAYRDGQVILRSERRAEGYTDAWTGSDDVKGVRVDDVVVHGLDGFAGSIGASESEGVCSPVYHVCRSITGDPLYLGRMLRVLALDGYLGLFATSTRQRAVDLRNWSLLGRIPVPSVPVEEQREIGAKIRNLRPLRIAVARSAERAAEHRQALITGAVTGRLKVPGVAA